MNDTNQTLQFSWSVWDNNPTISWSCNGNFISVSLTKPPLSVTNLLKHSLVAIVGSYEDLGPSNLLLYSYDGVLRQTIAAPQLGSSSQFGRVIETPSGVNAVIGFYDSSGWVEREGKLNLQDGTIEQLHRSY